jgi:type IV pilus assembly protein PilB
MTTPAVKRRKLGELLIADGQLTEEQLNHALAYQHRHGGRLGAILLNMGFVSEEAMISMLGAQMGIAKYEPTGTAIEHAVIKLVPEQMARRYQVLPVAKHERVLTLAMVDPLNVFAIDAVRQVTSLDVQPVVCREQEVLKGINRHYSLTSSAERAVPSGAEQRGQPDRLANSEGRPDPRIDGPQHVEALDDITLFREMRSAVGELKVEDAPVIKFVNTLLARAVREGASDIHIEPDSDVLRLRYRADGLLREVLTLPPQWQAGVISRIKSMANIDTAEKRIPQEGVLQITIEKKDLDIHVSTLPTIHGEKVVMRLLDAGNVLLGLDESGMMAHHLVPYRTLIHRPYGLILVTGPMGSGKSTTLYGSLQEINSIDKNIITVEDPVECQLKVINQVQVNLKAGVTFASGLRSILRQDPDVIMVGEIRDKETATLAIQAALTGHLVFATLHTNDAPTAATRLIDMGLEPFLVASTLAGMLAQRLVRRVCTRCRAPYDPPPELLRALNLNRTSPRGANNDNGSHQGAVFTQGKGCQPCRHTGYTGRVGLFELVVMDDTLRAMVTARATTAELLVQARKAAFVSLLDDGIIKAAQGLTTLEEVLRVTQEIGQ